MSLTIATSYFIALVAIALAPGPVALIMLVRSAGRDIRGAIGFGFGFSLGGVLIITAVCFGLGIWLTEPPEFFNYSKYVMLAYMLWLAFGIWKGGVDLDAVKDTGGRSVLKAFIAGILTCFISPYMMILFPLVLPGLVNITHIQLPEFAIVASLTFVALLVGSFIIIVFAAQIGRLVRSEKSLRVLNRGLASILAMAGTYMAFA